MRTYSPKQLRADFFNPLKPIYQLPGIVKLILKRQRHYLGLTLLALIDIIMAVGLVTNASFFSQAVDRVVLQQEMSAFSQVTGRPPFSTSIYIFPSQRNPVSLQDAEKIAIYIRQTLNAEISLPIRSMVVQVSSGSLMLQPSPESSLYSGSKSSYLGNFDAVYLDGISSHMEIIEGKLLDPDGKSKDSLDVWMYESAAQSMGVHIGEKLKLGINLLEGNLPVTVAGIWKAKDPKSQFWFNNPDSAYKTAFIIRRQDYLDLIQPMVSSGSGEASWYVILDESKVIPKQSASYLSGFRRSLDLINKFLPGARMNTPPLDPLTKFVDRSSAMTVLLIGYNLPAFGILLYFLVLTSTIISQWQRRETVMLVSRGMTAGGVLSLTVIEQLVLFLVGYPLGIVFGMFIAWAMGFTSSFLTFTNRAPLPVSIEGMSLPLTVLALTFSMLARVLPAIRAARSSLVTEERERARPMHRPLWYRLYLDLILLVPTFYAYDQMTKRGSLAGLVNTKPEDLYRDPLLIVVPALFILTISLVTMRVFALVMRLIDLVAGAIPWLTLHLALRQLGRQSLDYVQPLLLVIISLSMGVYTLSMAASLDQWAIDRMYYRVGADYTFTPAPSPSGTIPSDGGWVPQPGDFLDVNGIQATTRVARYSIRMTPSNNKEIRGSFLAIDRVDFPQVAWFRPDFASEPLGAMMNRLAFSPDGILVSQQFLEENGLKVGDYLTIAVSVENVMTVVSDFMVVGSYNYFPTVYAEDLAIIGNLEFLATQTGVTPPHDIWARLKPGVDTEQLPKEMYNTVSVFPVRTVDTRQMVIDEQSRLERIGIFGTLSVGFLATALMAILGLLIYSYASLQERAYRLAVLNAVGLSRNQILSQVVMEYAFLALFGAIAGATIGIVASNLFVPFFRYTGGKGVPLPPLVPIIASEQMQVLSLIFGITIVVVEVLTIATVLHDRLVQILKRVWI